MSLNTVSQVGRLAADPELRYTPAGKEVCNFRIAVQRNFKNDQGETEADFFSCTAWGHSAKFISDYATQGDLIGVAGRLQNHKYTHQEFGIPIVVTQIQCNDVQLIAKKGQNADGSPIERREGAQQRPAQGQQAQQRPATQQQSSRTSAPPMIDDFDENDPFADE